MAPSEVSIFSDPTYLKEDGSPEDGGSVFDTFVRVHPDNVETIVGGLKLFLQVNCTVYTKKEDVPNVKGIF